MTRRAGEPPEDDRYRTSLALSAAWADRLKATLRTYDIGLAEMVRRWIMRDEWLRKHTSPLSADRLYLHLADGRQEPVRLIEIEP